MNIRNGKALHVHDNKDEEGRQVIVWDKNANAQQRWKIIYLDEAAKVKTKGKNKEFGWEINRPFYLRSRLPMKRVAECVGANNLVLKRWRKNVTGQQFFFDEVTKTIRSQ